MPHRQFFCLPRLVHLELSLAREVNQSYHRIFRFSNLRMGREQHVLGSSNHSPHHFDSQSTARKSSVWSLSPFTRACFSPPLTFRADVATIMRVMVSPVVHPRLSWISHHIDIQSTARESHCVNTIWDHRKKTKKKTQRDVEDYVLKWAVRTFSHLLLTTCNSLVFLIYVIPMFFLYSLYNPNTIEQFNT